LNLSAPDQAREEPTMAVSAALTVVLALASAAGPDRVLLCRPKVAGNAGLARGEALVEAAKRTGRFLDYGVVCDDPPEGARAARRVGLGHALTATAEGRGDGTRYVLVLSDAVNESERARRSLDVAPGHDAVAPLGAALDKLLLSLPPPPGPRYPHLAAWATVGAGAVALVAGTAVAFSARDAADRANRANDPATYTHARSEWRSRRNVSAVLLGAGTLAVAGGLTWRYAF
jgi:hypothetical protein